MSVAIAKQQEALMKEAGKLKKFIKAVKKILAKEFLWVLTVVVLAIPLAFILIYLAEKIPEHLVDVTKVVKEESMFSVFYAISIAGIYFTRTVVGAINVLVEKKSKS